MRLIPALLLTASSCAPLIPLAAQTPDSVIHRPVIRTVTVDSATVYYTRTVQLPAPPAVHDTAWNRCRDGWTCTPPVTPPPPPPTDTTPAPPPSCGRAVTVATVAQLTSALTSARPGDCITLSAGSYSIGDLAVRVSGTAAQPITLRGPRTAVLTGTLHPQGIRYWRFVGFRVTAGNPWTVYADPMSYSTIDSLEVDHTAQEAIHLHGASTHNVVSNNYVHDTGTKRPEVAECIYLGAGSDGKSPADSNQVRNNRLERCGAEGIDVKEGTTGNIVQGNTITNVGLAKSIGSDAGIAIRGSGARVLDNTITGTPRYSMQVWPEAGWGKDNVVRGNRMAGYGKGYYGIQVRSGYQAGTTIGCDNTIRGGAKLADVPCVK